jgi:hypothetical protein
MKTATKKIVLTATGAKNKRVLNALENCRFSFSTRRIYTGYYLGSGRYTTRHTAAPTLISLLETQGYKFTEGNVSPQGGASGEYIEVSRVAFKFIEGLRK